MLMSSNKMAQARWRAGWMSANCLLSLPHNTIYFNGMQRLIARFGLASVSAALTPRSK